MVATVADLQVLVTANTSDAESGLSRVDKQVDKTASNSNKLAAGAGLLGFATVVAGGFAFAINSAANFDAQLSQIAAVGGAEAQARMAEIEKTALSLGASTSFSASEAAAGMTELVKAGVPVEDVLNGGADAMLALAAATGTSVPQAASVMSASMTILGDTSEQAANRISAAANASRLDVGQWGDAIQQAGPIAKALGVSADELTTSIVLLSNAGFSGAEAGTAMRNVITGLVNPTDKAKKALDKYGVVTKDAKGNFVGLENVISQIGPQWDSMNDSQKAAFAEAVVGKENMAGFITLMEGGSEAWTASEEAIANQATAQAQANQMTDNLKGAMDALMGSVETVAIVIGQSLTPYVQAAADAINGLVQRFLSLSPQAQNIIVGVIAVVAAIALLAGGMVVATAATGVLTAGLGLLFSPVIGIVLLIAALGAALYYAYTTNFLGFADGIDWLVGKLGEFWDWLKDVADYVLSLDWSGMWDSIKTTTTTAWNSIKTTVESTWNTISTAVSTAITTIQSVLSTAWGAIQSTATTAWNFIKLAISNPMEAARVAINTALESIKTILSTAWTVIQTGAALAWEGIKLAIQLAIAGIKLYIETYILIIQTVISTAWEAIQAVTSAIWGALPGLISSAWSAIQLAVSTALNTIQSAISTAWASVQSTISTSVNSIKSTIQIAWSVIQSSVQTSMTSLQSTLNSTWTAISSHIASIVNTIKMTVTSAFTSAKDTVTTATSTLKSNVTSSITTLLASVTTTFASIKSAITTPISSAKESVVTTMTGMASSIVGTLTGLFDSVFNAAYNIGSAIGQGIIAGINAMWDSVVGFAKSLADAVMGVLKKVPGINSPSKVTTYLGEMIGLGYANGMNSMIPEVSYAGAALATSAVPMMPSASYAAPSSTSSTNVYISQTNTIDASNVEELLNVSRFLSDLEPERVNTFGHSF